MTLYEEGLIVNMRREQSHYTARLLIIDNREVVQGVKQPTAMMTLGVSLSLLTRCPELRRSPGLRSLRTEPHSDKAPLFGLL